MLLNNKLKVFRAKTIKICVPFLFIKKLTLVKCKYWLLVKVKLRNYSTQFQKYITAVSFYDLIKKEIPNEDWINLQFNIQNDRRNTRLTFQTNNYRCELNRISNRFKSISNEIEKEWIDATRDAYKTRCKKRLITDKLIMLWWDNTCY